MQQQQPQLAHRISVESPVAAAASAPQTQTSVSSVSLPINLSLKSPRSLVQPVAQMALKHLFNSLAQGSVSVNAGGAASGGGSGHRTAAETAAAVISSSSETQQRSIAPQGDVMQAAASGSSSSELAAPMTQGRALRSLPIGAAPAPGQHPPSVASSGQSDQDTAESSYGGHMPAYHMGGGGYGGGYGGGGGDNYQSEHDKKSKGITFHFGGGPIGGGTQLITSPMGIFKHLMIPLLPNPRGKLFISISHTHALESKCKY